MQKLTEFVQRELAARADAGRAPGMAAYMKTDMPFYGVMVKGRREIRREILRRFPITNRRDYKRAVLALWRLPHREEKYMAIGLASACEEFIDVKSLALYERLIREGAWWDFVDSVAIDLVGGALKKAPRELYPVMDRWIDDEHLWIRRTAIIAQNSFKADTDARRLFRYCLGRADEKEFFIRKAIGWALREYSYAKPEAVRDFLVAHREELSGLSYREGAKRLIRVGLL